MNSLSLYDFEKDLKTLHLDLNVSEFYELTEYSALGVPPIRDRIPPVVQSVPLTN